MKKKYFFGWTNIKWLIKELIYVLSYKSSFFSKKRVDAAVAFIIGQIGMIGWLLINITTINVTEIIAWSTIEFFIAGYNISQIQKEKIRLKNDISEDKPTINEEKKNEPPV